MPDQNDNRRVLARRQALGKLGILSGLGLLGSPVRGAPARVAPPSTPGRCVLIPTETEGPFPLLAVLSNAAINRSDVTEGRTGIPLHLKLRVQDVSRGCAPIRNAAVYIWHCDKDGNYSGYGSARNEAGTFLRGVQRSDANGDVGFKTIFPGWYPGRIAHIHFQIYLNDNRKVRASVTSQLTFPKAVTAAVYETALYRRSGENSSVRDFRRDGVFADGEIYQTVAVSGDPAAALTAFLDVGIAGGR